MSRFHAFLPVAAKRFAWNVKYGLLKYPVWTAAEDGLRQLRARLSESTSVLELGCGRGSMLRALREGGWTGHYCGVDISKRAISAAHRLADQRSSWIVSDFETFSSPFTWDAIVMIESIYYVNLRALPGVLGRVTGMLNESGFLLVRLHDLEEHREYVDAIYRLFPRTEKVSDHLFYIDRPL
jgi:predicted TPR repeat methyltransferase